MIYVISMKPIKDIILAKFLWHGLKCIAETEKVVMNGCKAESKVGILIDVHALSY